MKVLLKQARIVCTSSPFHGLVKDIFITNGVITKIADQVSEHADEIIANDNLHVSIGWMDTFAHFTDPGYEQKEALETGAAAAAAGGFTDVFVVPNTNPVITSKAQVEYILQKASSLPVNIYPLASITKHGEGKELAEMYDMHQSGAIAFTDGINPVQSPGVLLKALQYVSAVDATIIQLPDDKSISGKGLMNEGIASTRSGLPGKPAIAEELMIARDIELLRYTRSKLHITSVSTAKGISLVEDAKKEGLRLSCSVTPYHCFFCDEDLAGYDTNLKVDPPLRTREDMESLRIAVIDGKVDCISSHHIPQHWDDKACEFEYAKNGMEGLESVFGAMNNIGAPIDQLIELLSVAPRKIFDLPVPQLAENAPACLTLFDPETTYTFDESCIRSRSKNNAFTGHELKGNVIGIINKGKTCINDHEKS